MAHIRQTSGVRTVLVATDLYHRHGQNQGRLCDRCGARWTVSREGESVHLWMDGRQADTALLDTVGNNVAIECCQSGPSEAKRLDRVDASGRAYAGSQRQIQTWVNERSAQLNGIICDTLPALASFSPRINWVSPLKGNHYVEYQDTAFLRALALEALAPKLKEFWPTGGPVWDALALIEGSTDGGGVLLVEAKSHLPEVFGSGCQASEKSLAKIKAALAATKGWLGVPEAANWLGRIYQSANRLAHLYFLREVCRVNALLINVYFLNDPHSPTSPQQWRTELAAVKTEIGLDKDCPFVASVFLEALP